MEEYPEERKPIRVEGKVVAFFFVMVIALIAALASLNIYIKWTVLQSLYSLKFNVNWFSTVFYGGYTFIVAALAPLLLLNPKPGKSDLYSAYDAFHLVFYRLRGGEERPFKPNVKAWAVWQALKYALGYLVVASLNGFPFYSNLTLRLKMLQSGIGDWRLIPRILALPINPPSNLELIRLIPTMEAQYRVLLSIVGPILIILAVRFTFKFVRNLLLLQRNAYLRDLFAISSIIALHVVLDAPYWSMDITTPYGYLIAVTALIGFLTGLGYFQINVNRSPAALPRRRKTIFTAFAVILILIILGNGVVVAGFRVNWNNNWTQYEWRPLIEKQIALTRWAAGIQNIQYESLTELKQGNESKTLSYVRQWDQQAANTKMKNQIGVNWMRLSDSDIVFINGREYWVSPTTINYPATDWISRKLIYTHAAKIIIIDSHTGEFVPVEDAFGVEREPNIYYGEQMYEHVYVNVKGFNEIGNVSYAGEPDYVLKGWRRTLWFLLEGQLGFAFTPPQDSINMLYRRDVYERVNGVLIYGLNVDEDVFIVTDGARVYYCAQVYVAYPIRSGFSASQYLRFFGVVTVDVENGEMKGYYIGEPDGFLIDFYRSYYPGWGNPPTWLKSQLRYPEELLGGHEKPGQLDVDFIFHVQDPFIWRSGSDFFERPEATMVHYILMDFDNETRYVGIQLVEYEASPGKNLAGIYVAEGGESLGRITLFRISTQGGQLIGPSAALQALETDDYVRKQLTLLTNPRLGNILLYIIRGRPFYFIPVYITTQVAESVITKLAFMVMVDASTGTNVSAGGDSAQAFYTLTGRKPMEELGVEKRAGKVVQALETLGYRVTHPEKINANVEIHVGETQYLKEEDWPDVENALIGFLKAYADDESDVYYWSPSEGTLAVGVLKSTQGIVKLYYVTIMLEEKTVKVEE
ncbi:MAG: UPF0182 family protein [Thermoproteota archaeon]